MATENDTLTIYIDSHQEIEFEVDDIADLVGTEIKWKLALKVDGDVIIEKSSTVAAQLDFADDKFTVYLEPDDNRDLMPGLYYHEARIQDVSDNTRPVAYGNVNVVDTLTSGG